MSINFADLEPVKSFAERVENCASMSDISKTSMH